MALTGRQKTEGGEPEQAAIMAMFQIRASDAYLFSTAMLLTTCVTPATCWTSDAAVLFSRPTSTSPFRYTTWSTVWTLIELGAPRSGD